MVKLFIVGQPGECGGASTELLDQIKIWKLLNIEIHIIPTVDNYTNDDSDIIVHSKNSWCDIDGNQCIAFSNKEFLRNLEFIRPHSKKIIWVNCMTHSFHDEIVAQSKGFIDLHLYQTYHGYKSISYKLKFLGKKFNYKLFHPYFDITGFDYNAIKNPDIFSFGRISRSDPVKYSNDQFQIYDSIECPNKHCYVLGYSNDIRNKIYVPNPMTCDYYLTLYKSNEISRYEFYDKIDVLCMKTNTMENLPRVGFECMATGTLMVVDDRGGWRLLVVDKETGFLCKSKEEFIEVMNYIAKNPDVKKEMVEKSFIKLQTEYSTDRSKFDWSNILLN